MSASITCCASEFSILGTDPAEYPELPSVDHQNAVSIPQNILGKMIRQTIFAVSDNESRPVYTGSLFEVESDRLTIEAHRQNIMRKLGIHSVAGLTRYAMREGITGE